MDRSGLVYSGILVLTLMASRQGSAQVPTRYRWAASDTVRFLERTDGRVTMDTPNGAAQIKTEHEARIAVVAVAPTELRAWYETLRLQQTGPGGHVQTPATEAMLGQPFILQLSAMGEASTTEAPSIPEEIAALTDLTRQFDDFFVSLPAEPLVVGVAWADTVIRNQPGRPTDTYLGRTIRRYRAMRDTVVSGASAVVIAVEQDVTIDASSRMDAQQLTATVSLVGEEHGEAIFAPELGQLVARTRRGHLTGDLKMEGAAGTVSLPQVFEYMTTLRRLP